MEYTNEIRFNRKPKNNKLLKITYSGNLFKNNSNEVYIVYGFGENWEKTTEQKMEKSYNGFIATILIENYNTFNFCFRNDQNIWDNNNNFNYIAQIDISCDNSEIDTLSENDNNEILTASMDNIINNIDLNLEVPKAETTVEVDNSILDTLIQQLFEEYDSKNESFALNAYEENNAVDKFEEVEIQNNSNNVINEESSALNAYEENNVVDKFEEVEIQNNTNNVINEENSKVNIFKNVSNLFDEVIEEIEANSSKPITNNIDVGIELDKKFNELFIEKNIQPTEVEENYIPSPTTWDLFDENDEKDEIENDIFDFENKEFDFNLNENIEISQPQSELEINFNSFSDSYYDDDTQLEGMTSIQEIVNDTVNELNTATSIEKINEENESFQKQTEEFDKAVNEYAEYFDNLIEEIVSFPTSSLSSSISNEEVFKNEQTDLAINQSQNLAVSNSDTPVNVESGSDSVPDEYALYDYKSHSMFYMIKRRFKLLLSSIFTKLPKIFGKETDSDNQ